MNDTLSPSLFSPSARFNAGRPVPYRVGSQARLTARGLRPRLRREYAGSNPARRISPVR